MMQVLASVRFAHEEIQYSLHKQGRSRKDKKWKIEVADETA